MAARKTAAKKIGRPPSEVRERCKGSFWERIAVLESIADNPKATSADRIRAMDTLGKYGGLQRVDVTSDDEPIEPTVIVDFGSISTEELRSILEGE
jgi:hypothetical protein